MKSRVRHLPTEPPKHPRKKKFKNLMLLKGALGWLSCLSIQLWHRSYLMVCGFEPCVELCADSLAPGTCFRFCLSVCLSVSFSLSALLLLAFCLSKINETLKNLNAPCKRSPPYHLQARKLRHKEELFSYRISW